MAVLILFAGTGVPEACRQLGLPTHEVESDTSLKATRATNGFVTAYTDPLDVHNAAGLDFDTVWASPPFAVRDHKAIMQSIENRDWREYDVLLPMAYVDEYKPENLILEQTPEALPIWDALAEILRERGYSAWTGHLDAETFGLAQIRRHAYLIARLNAEAYPPRPSHSRYNHTQPSNIDTGVQVWRSMAEAIDLYGDLWLCSPNHERPLSVPARMLTEAAAGYLLVDSFDERVTVESRLLYRNVSQTPMHNFKTRPLSVTEAAVLQGFPPKFSFVGNRARQFAQITGAVPPPVAAAILRSLAVPTESVL